MRGPRHAPQLRDYRVACPAISVPAPCGDWRLPTDGPSVQNSVAGEVLQGLPAEGTGQDNQGLIRPDRSHAP